MHMHPLTSLRMSRPASVRRALWCIAVLGLASVAVGEGWDFDPDVPVSSRIAETSSWALQPFPPGSGIYGGYPHGPWSVAGNSSGEFFVSLAREDLYPTDDTHILLARSTDSGGS